jgi:phosphoglycolate phosphatase-like HAD superfamily hydrolase
MEGHYNKQLIMVGDRQSDVKAGKENGLLKKLEGADLLINDFLKFSSGRMLH